MRSSYICLALACAIAVASGCGDSLAPNEIRRETFQWNGQVALGGEVEVKNISGNITFTQGSASNLQVEAIKTSDTRDVSVVTIAVVEHAGGVVICAMYPTPIGRPPNECVSGVTGNYSTDNVDVDVDFTVRVPPDRPVTASTISGALSASGLENEIVFTTISGSIVIATTEIAEATAISGNITASIGRTEFGRDLAFSTISGNVTVMVPAGCNAFAVVSVVSGTVSSDFPLTTVAPGHLQGMLGVGGSQLRVSSISGSARLLRGS